MTMENDAMAYFETERATYRANLDELLAHEGKFVAIKGDTIAGVSHTYDQVIELGYERFGPVPFLVKRIYKDGQPSRRVPSFL